MVYNMSLSIQVQAIDPYNLGWESTPYAYGALLSLKKRNTIPSAQERIQMGQKVNVYR